MPGCMSASTLSAQAVVVGCLGCALTPALSRWGSTPPPWRRLCARLQSCPHFDWTYPDGSRIDGRRPQSAAGLRTARRGAPPGLGSRATQNRMEARLRMARLPPRRQVAGPADGCQANDCQGEGRSSPKMRTPFFSDGGVADNLRGTGAHSDRVPALRLRRPERCLLGGDPGTRTHFFRGVPDHLGVGRASRKKTHTPHATAGPTTACGRGASPNKRAQSVLERALIQHRLRPVHVRPASVAWEQLSIPT